jgi:glucans biosynthesis protein C
MEKTKGKRSAFLDNIRWTVIAMVVLMHACVTYGGLGSWYYKEGAAVGLLETLVFYFYQLFSQAFFMGILFFIAAVLTPGAYDRKGFGKFIRDRLLRLGAPALIYVFVLHPLASLIRETGLGNEVAWAGFLDWYRSFLGSGLFLKESGPLWFAIALLAFSLVYALCRLALRLFRKPGSEPMPPKPRSARTVHLGALVLIVVMTLGSFLVRLAWPMGTSWYNMQLCFFFQYIAMFSAGLWAARSGFLEWLSRSTGRIWFRLSLIVGIPAWLLLLGLGGAMTGNQDLYLGGWHWQAAAFAAWESFFCVAFSLGLLSLYRERANGSGRLSKLLSETCFGIYCFHAPILVGMSMILRKAAIFPLGKALVVAALSWLISLGAAWLVRSIPGLGKIFR